MNPSVSACMHNHHLSHLCGRFCQAPREKSRYFSTAPRIQDGRLHVGREYSPFRPVHALLSYSFSREPLPSSSFFTRRAHARAHIGIHMHDVRARHVFSLLLSCVDICNFQYCPASQCRFSMRCFFFYKPITSRAKTRSRCMYEVATVSVQYTNRVIPSAEGANIT